MGGPWTEWIWTNTARFVASPQWYYWHLHEAALSFPSTPEQSSGAETLPAAVTISSGALIVFLLHSCWHRSKQLEAVLVISRSKPSSAQITAWSLSFWQDSNSHEVSHSQCLSDIYDLSPQKGRNFPLPPSLNSTYKHFETSHEGRHTTYTSSR